MRLNLLTASAIVLVVPLMSLAARLAQAEITGPYTVDANTLHLWHFDETSGGNDPGNPFVDAAGSAAHNLTNTGGHNGRSNSTAGGYGGAAISGFGSSFNPLLSGSGGFHSTTSTVGGGALTGGAVPQSTLQGANGAFTWEALVFVSGKTQGEHTILSHDGDAQRGPMLRVIVDGSGNGELNWFNGISGQSTAAALPTSGDHAFEIGEWYHVAATYTGEAGPDNFKLYWTALDADPTEASLLGTFSLPGDAFSSSNLFGVGGATRTPFRFEWEGLIDEVRISEIARGPGDFLFAAPTAPVPEASSGAAFAIAGLFAAAVVWRRRK